MNLVSLQGKENSLLSILINTGCLNLVSVRMCRWDDLKGDSFIEYQFLKKRLLNIPIDSNFSPILTKLFLDHDNIVSLTG